jgi:DNA-binding IscR family transcriptional regulator
VLESLDRRARGTPDTQANDRVALRMCCLIAGRFASGEKPLDKGALAERLGLDESVIERMAAKLREQDLLIETASEPTGLMLAHPPDQVSVWDILQLFRVPDARAAESVPRLDLLLRELEAARRTRVGELTLSDLVAEPALRDASAPARVG